MAKQTFTTGQILTAANMTSLQQTAMGGGSATAKTTNYVLVSADAGGTVAMNAAGSTTITVNSGLFAAGDTVFIQNLGAGSTTITAGTATVSTAGSLILPQYDAGILYFTATGASIFYDYIQTGAASPLTTKGDLYTFSTSDARLAVGTNTYVLTADSAEATGLKWASAAAASFPTFSAFRNTSNQGFSSSTFTKVQLNGEAWDSDNCFDSTTNYRFTPTTAGYYQINATIGYSTGGLTENIVAIYKNGSKAAWIQYQGNAGNNSPTYSGSMLLYLNGSTDYIEMYVFGVGSSLNVEAGATTTIFSAAGIRS